MKVRSRLVLALVAGVVAAVLAVVALPTTAGAAPYCGITWGSLPKSTAEMTGAHITGVRPGRHDCFDRLVVDLAGKPAPGYDVRYIDRPYRAPGTGDALSVAGGAVLQIIARAPAYDENGNATVPWRGAGTAIVRPGQFQAGGFRTFRHLVWGGTYEGQSSFGLGVRARLPFRVFTLDGPGTGSRLVVDVAHRW
ncbi:MAG: hypothetical protein M3203_10460 [Actinomycetota bacterium]|nr:hypothetical protein [Actinomycetota bacterium]